MKNLLIGSRALAFWNPDLKLKNSTDCDVISDKPIPGTEWHKPDFLDNYKMENYASDNFIYINGHKVYIVNMTGLAIIKRSHLWRQLGFQKHITHYYKYKLCDEFNSISTKDYNIFLERENLTLKAFPFHHPKLNKTKEEFFGDGLYRKYDHDYLHELVALRGLPSYKSLQLEGDEVICRKEKWDLLPIQTKLCCVVEEVYVTALERFILVDNPIPFKLAYSKSLDKVCTTMCSGWFRSFAIDFYPELQDLYNEEVITKVLKQLGEIK